MLKMDADNCSMGQMFFLAVFMAIVNGLLWMAYAAVAVHFLKWAIPIIKHAAMQ